MQPMCLEQLLLKKCWPHQKEGGAKQLSAKEEVHRRNYFAETTEAIWPWIKGLMRARGNYYWGCDKESAGKKPTARQMQEGPT